MDFIHIIYLYINDGANINFLNEAYCEPIKITWIKWALLISVILLLNFKTKIYNYLILLLSLGIIILFIKEGPLSHILCLFDSLFFWIIFLLAMTLGLKSFYSLIVLVLKKLTR